MSRSAGRRPRGSAPAVRAVAGALPFPSRAFEAVAPSAFDRGLARLADDFRTGAWRARYAGLLHRVELDCGLRLVVGEGY